MVDVTPQTLLGAIFSSQRCMMAYIPVFVRQEGEYYNEGLTADAQCVWVCYLGSFDKMRGEYSCRRLSHRRQRRASLQTLTSPTVGCQAKLSSPSGTTRLMAGATRARQHWMPSKQPGDSHVEDLL